MTSQTVSSTLALTIRVAGFVLAATTPLNAASTKISRDVIALYDSVFEPYPHSTMIHQVVEMPLNHLGLRVTYMDLRKTLPDVTAAANYRGVLLWLKSGTNPPRAALEWVANVADAGARIVLMGDITEFAADGSAPVDRLLARFGLRHAGYEIEATYRARVTRSDDVIAAAERRLDPPLPPFPVVILEMGRSEAHLAVTHPKASGVVESVLVATGPAGGFIAANYAVSYDPALTANSGWLSRSHSFVVRCSVMRISQFRMSRRSAGDGSISAI